MRRLETLNFYEVLEISPNANQAEVRGAYERAKRIYSPDSIAVYSLLDKKEIEEMSRLVEEAYHVIGNETRRRAYDQVQGCSGKKEEEPVEPTCYDHLPQTASLGGAEAKPPSPGQQKEIEEMISQSGFEYTGPALRRIREVLGLELAEISQRTKVSRANLLFIEEENHAHLPALVYLKGFLSEYAKCLGLDACSVLEDYVPRYRNWEKSRDIRP